MNKIKQIDNEPMHNNRLLLDIMNNRAKSREMSKNLGINLSNDKYKEIIKGNREYREISNNSYSIGNSALYTANSSAPSPSSLFMTF